jgi:hypothetical protein
VPRYYFHIHNDLDAEDEEGTELPDLAAAREHALKGARDLVCHDIKQGHVNLDHHIIVANASGDELLKVSFRDAFTIAG